MMTQQTTPKSTQFPKTPTARCTDEFAMFLNGMCTRLFGHKGENMEAAKEELAAFTADADPCNNSINCLPNALDTLRDLDVAARAIGALITTITDYTRCEMSVNHAELVGVTRSRVAKLMPHVADATRELTNALNAAGFFSSTQERVAYYCLHDVVTPTAGAVTE